MTEPEELVWYEADGTRHVLGAPAGDGSGAPSDGLPGHPAARVEESTAGETGVDEPIEQVAVVETQVEDADLVDPEDDRAPIEETEARDPRVEQGEAEDSQADESADERSALRGMVRALAIGAAAAAATGAAVGAISLAATGDRPDTSDEIVPTTAAALDRADEPAASLDSVERVDLTPSTTAADQPG